MQERLFCDGVSCSAWDSLCCDCLEFIASDPFVDIDQFLEWFVFVFWGHWEWDDCEFCSVEFEGPIGCVVVIFSQ